MRARGAGAAGGAGPVRTLLTVVAALAVLTLIAVGGGLLRTERPSPSATAGAGVGRTTSICAVGTVPEPSADPSADPSGDPSGTSGAPTPSPATPQASTPVATPGAPPSPGATPAPTPSLGSAPPGQVAVVVSNPAAGPGTGATPAPAGTPDPNGSPASTGKVTAGPLGSDAIDLTVDRLGHGARLEQAGAPVVLQADGAMASASTGAVFGVNRSGVETGLLGAPCLPPATTAWFPGVAAGTDDRTELVLSNPDDAQAEVDLKFYGRDGRVVVPGSPGVVVPARSSRSVSLTSLVGTTGPLGLSVEAGVGRVSAAARRLLTQGNRPAGADWAVPAATPSLVSVVPAVPGGDGSRQLVVTNPGLLRAQVQVQVLGLQGPYAPVGAETLEVPAESSATADLAPGLAGGGAGVKLSSDQPVTGAVVSASRRTGATSDIAVQSGAAPLTRSGVSAIATTDAADSELVLSNGADVDTPVTFEIYSYDGVLLRSDDVLLAANGSATRRLNSPAPSYVVLRVPDGSVVVGGVVLSSAEGQVAGLATIPLTSPDVAGRSPVVVFDPAAGR